MIQHIRHDEWHEHASCRNKPTHIFIPDEDTNDYAAALNICKHCPVKPQCLDLAMKSEEPGYRYGVFGGLTPEQRETLPIQRK